MTVTVTPVNLYELQSHVVFQLKFTKENPFLVKEGFMFTDGPCYYLETAKVESDDYGIVDTRKLMTTARYVHGYRVTGYTDEIAHLMGRTGCYLMMGNGETQTAWFRASDANVEKFQRALFEGGF